MRIIAIGAVVVVGLLVAGIAFAAIPDQNGVIHGCYTKQGGLLRVINTESGQHCFSWETALDWNQQGPPGPQGPAGPPGPTAAFVEQGPGPISINPGPNQIGELDLPAGNYVVFARAMLSELAGGAECGIAHPPNPNFDSVTVQPGPSQMPVMLMGAVALAEPGMVVMSCSATEAGMASSIALLAMPVDTLMGGVPAP